MDHFVKLERLPDGYEIPRNLEEKFYFVWPLLAFVLLRRRFRARLAFALAAAVAFQVPVAIWAGGRVVYRGRIDDRYVDLGVERPAPTRHDLADALTASLGGKPAPHPRTQAVGCFISDFAR